MQTPKARNSPTELPKKVSPRAVRSLKITTEPHSATSSTQTLRAPKERSPKVVERRSPRSPITSEAPKKRPSKLSELEGQLSQVQEDLKKAKDQLNLSESCKKKAEQDAEESKHQLLFMTSKLEESQKQLHDSKKEDLLSLEENLEQTFSVVEDMKIQLKESKESEAEARALVNETLLELETAKENVETLKLDREKSTEDYNLINCELDQSRARVKLLEGLVSKLNSDFMNGGKMFESSLLEEKLKLFKSEVEKLKDDLEVTEVKYHEEQIRSIVEINTAYELLDKINFTSSKKMADLEIKLEKNKSEIEEVSQSESELTNALKKTEEKVADLKANLMDKETEFQNILEENEILKSKLEKKESEENFEELETLRRREKEAATKLEHITEEVEKSGKRAARVAEQLEAAQSVNGEMEAELRRLKVQSDQWRKAAEAAAAMISAGHHHPEKLMNRTGSMDSSYNPVIGSPYSDDTDDDIVKKKNGNVLKKIGVLWKKSNK